MADIQQADTVAIKAGVFKEYVGVVQTTGRDVVQVALAVGNRIERVWVKTSEVELLVID